MPDRIRIKGGNKLIGETNLVPNKNAILAALPAAILTDETVVYKGVSDTSDVQKILEIMKRLGAKVTRTGTSDLRINCSSVKSFEVDKELGTTFRASLMLAGPLLARFGRAHIPLPGGCTLGTRSIASHLDNFLKIGISSLQRGEMIQLEVGDTPGNIIEIWQQEASVTATENLFMYLAGSGIRATVIGAACEPHVVQLTQLLSSMGASIFGVGSNKVTISGSDKLGSATFVPEPDFVDIAGFIVAAAVTGGKIRLKNGNYPHIIGGLVSTFEKFNIGFEYDVQDLIVSGENELLLDPEKCNFPLAEPGLPKISPRPWPGFPADVIPVLVTLATKTKGSLLVQNWMYEHGLEFVEDLNFLGANVELLDPQKALIKGPAKFKGGNVTSPAVIQACKALFLAALADPVCTEIKGVDILKRRYPDIFEVYKNLGADIEVLE